jgi:hypothetical protein
VLATLAGLTCYAGEAERPQLYAVWEVISDDGTVSFGVWTAAEAQAEKRKADQAYSEKLRQWRNARKLDRPRRAVFKQRSKYSPELEKMQDLARKLQDEYDKKHEEEIARKKLAAELKRDGLTLADTKAFCVMELATDKGPVFQAVSLADYKRKVKVVESEYEKAVKEWVAARAAARKAGKRFDEPRPTRGIKKHGRFRKMADAEAYCKRLEEKEASKGRKAEEPGEPEPATKEGEAEEAE